MTKHRARKRFGQNFLSDNVIIERILKAIHPRPIDHMVEIGPGLGALTYPLLDQVGRLDVIEIDRDLAAKLTPASALEPKLVVHLADALNFDFAPLSTESHALRVVGNLPYNISSPLLFHLLSFCAMFADMHFMLQKEVALRIAATAGENNYGRLSIMIQYYCTAEYLFTVPPTAFSPAPKVDSAIIRLIPHRTLPFKALNENLFADLVRTAFSKRRKTIKNSLKTLVSDEIWAKSDINVSLRPEQIKLEEYVQLANILYNNDAL